MGQERVPSPDTHHPPPARVPHIDNRGMGWARMVAGVSTPEESPSCTEHGCPVKAGEARGRPRVDSPDWRAACRARATETKPVYRGEKGNPPRSNLRIGR